jgi:2-alkyl-3-oxoalkanoate reductase
MRVERIAEPILVTGATGFIGRRLVDRLRRERYAVRAFVLPDEAPPDAWTDVEVVAGDVTRIGDVAKPVREARTVFHLAAMVGDWGRPEVHQRVTVRGTEHVLGEAARAGGRVILASSIVVYGHQLASRSCDEHLPLGRPQGAYSQAKQAQERVAAALEESHGLKVTVIRPANVYGPRSVPWVDKVVEHLAAGRPSLIGDGRRDAGLAYVDNVVDVFLRAAERPAAIGRTYNACDECGVTWRRYFSDLAAMIGAPAPASLPSQLAKIVAHGSDAVFRLLGRDDRPRSRERPSTSRARTTASPSRERGATSATSRWSATTRR